VKLATWNVNGIRAREADVAAFVERERPDVLCLQEIKATPAQVPEALCALPGYWCYWHGTKGYSGVSLHVHRDYAPDQPKFLHPEFDAETRIVVADLGALSIASVYVPNGGKDFAAKIGFMTALAAYAAAARAVGRRLVICGDMNITLTPIDVHPRERNPTMMGQRSDERALFRELLEEGGLHDIGRERDPNNEELFTWWAPWRNMRERNIGWRLDYVLASAPIFERVRACIVQREVGTSDHGPVLATFDL
jgi:exodeoxyribonuclease III